LLSINVFFLVSPLARTYNRGITNSNVQTEYGCLTKREREVLQLIVDGHGTKQVAAILGIAFKTAVCHRTHIMEKLHVNETASLVRCAIQLKLVDI
jgi:FixJ family two-component response regulator